MKKLILCLLLILPVSGDQCLFSLVQYVMKCEFSKQLNEQECNKAKQAIINLGCESTITEYNICKNDLIKLCGSQATPNLSQFGKCFMDNLSNLSPECRESNLVQQASNLLKPIIPSQPSTTSNVPSDLESEGDWKCLKSIHDYTIRCANHRPECVELRNEIANGACLQYFNDIKICEKDIVKLCPPTEPVNLRVMGQCIVDNISNLSDECTNTATMKKLLRFVNWGKCAFRIGKYALECEVNGKTNTNACVQQRNELSSSDCSSLFNDFSTCKSDIAKFCPPETPFNYRKFGECFVQSVPKFDEKCGQTELMKTLKTLIKMRTYVEHTQPISPTTPITTIETPETGFHCMRKLKNYVAQCELAKSYDDICASLQMDMINKGCEQTLKDFKTCREDFSVCRSQAKEGLRGVGKCIVDNIPKMKTECVNTALVKKISKRVKSCGCMRSLKDYVMKCEITREGRDEQECSNLKTLMSTQGCDRTLSDYAICRNDFHKLCPYDPTHPRRFGTCLVDNLSELNEQCAKTELVAKIVRWVERSEEPRSEEWHRRCQFKVHHIGAIVITSVLFVVGLFWVIRERTRRGVIRLSRKPKGMNESSWSTGLFGTWDSVIPEWRTCLPSFIFPHFQQSLNQAELNDRDCSFVDLLFNLPHAGLAANIYRDRQDIRAKYNIPEDSCGDCLSAVFCQPCSIAQNAREINTRVGLYETSNPHKLSDSWSPDVV